jgi:glycosyltransferase involved in cell wall biosynthesis
MIDRIVVINDFSTSGGGAATLAVSSAVWLQQRGFRLSFISGDNAKNSLLSSNNIEHVGMGGRALLNTSAIRAMRNGLFNIAACRAVSEWIEQNDTPETVYHLHNWSQIFSPAIFLALRRISARLVLSAHDFFLACPNGAYANFKTGAVCPLVPLSRACLTTNCDRRNYGHKLWRAVRQLIVNSLRDLDGGNAPIIALHEGMIPFLERGGISRANIRVLRNPVEPFSKVRIRAEHNRAFVYIGRLHEGKGPDLAAKAAQLAGASLCLIGDGPQRSALERDHPEIMIAGWQPSNRIIEWVGKARALIVPSRYPEPFGLVAVEALLSGLPVIIASSALLASEIEERGIGYACEPLDISAMAGLMRRLMQDDELTRTMSERAVESAPTLATTPAVWTSELVRLYEQRLTQKPQTLALLRTPVTTADIEKSHA